MLSLGADLNPGGVGRVNMLLDVRPTATSQLCVPWDNRLLPRPAVGTAAACVRLQKVRTSGGDTISFPASPTAIT